MQQSDQKIDPDQTNEIDLRRLVNSFVARKLLIFGLTGFGTLLAIIVALNLTPTFKATSSFISPTESSIININKLNLTTETKESVFTNFLTRLSSRDMQTKVFIDGGYLTAFNPQNNPIDDVDSFISGSIESVNVNPPNLNRKELVFGFLTELPYSISIEGANAEVISRYLNELVTTTDKITVETIMNSIEQKLANQIERIKEEDVQKIREINDLIYRERFQAKERRLNKIVELTDSARLAKSLGIIENSFHFINDASVDSNLTITIYEDYHVPSWYLYGEKALLQRAESLQSRTSDDPYIPALASLINQLHEVQNNNLLITLEARQDKIKLESYITDITGVHSMQLSQVAITPTNPTKPNKGTIVLLAFIGSFMMSILLASVMNVLKPDEMHST